MSAATAMLGGRTFRSLREHRNYRLWFTGQVISVSGTWMQNTAQAWLVLQLTGSAAAVGLLATFQFGPYAVLGLAGGVLSDRFDRRKTLVVTQAAPILMAAALAILAGTHRATVWEVDLIAALNGLVLVLDTPTRQAFTVEMVGRSELPNAVALNSSLFNMSRIVGPGIGGLVIAAFGVAACFALNGLSYLAVLTSLLLMNPAELYRSAAARRPPVLRGIVDGLAYARRTPVIRAVLLMMLVVGTISINFNVLLPVVTTRTLHQGPEVLGLLSASFGLGALIGALVNATFNRADFAILLAGCTGLGLAELGVGWQRSVVGTVILLVLTGVVFTTYTANSNALLQLTVPDRLRGRVLSLYAYVFFGTAPLGGWFAGWLAERDTTLAFGVAGAAALTTGLLGTLWWAGTTGRLRRRVPPPVEGDVQAAR